MILRHNLFIYIYMYIINQLFVDIVEYNIQPWVFGKTD